MQDLPHGSGETPMSPATMSGTEVMSQQPPASSQLSRLQRRMGLLRRHHETNQSHYDNVETSLTDQSQQETNKLREKLTNVKGKKKRPEQRKENNGFLQMQRTVSAPAPKAPFNAETAALMDDLFGETNDIDYENMLKNGYDMFKEDENGEIPDIGDLSRFIEGTEEESGLELDSAAAAAAAATATATPDRPLTVPASGGDSGGPASTFLRSMAERHSGSSEAAGSAAMGSVAPPPGHYGSVDTSGGAGAAMGSAGPARFMAGSASPMTAGMQPGMMMPGGPVRPMRPGLRPQMGGQQMMMMHQRTPGMVPVQQQQQQQQAMMAAMQQQQQQQRHPQQQMAPAGFPGYGTTVSEGDGSAAHTDSFKFGQEELQNMMTFNRSNSMPY
ncbi:hypothetical protein FJT64_003530 [Amphibalanus amphitrite]|uniref:Neurogenic mastermind-like N-terminal domain-containing protein n=1 Tax=Amphibalanus amphitrite TaxID=1232801 RepID=A0A6A4VSV2_AMPAM|nr:hypothetical protein FJT64_003530 [Amphibalanus amphitrite]